MLKMSLPKWAVEEAGAPREVWTQILSPPDTANLYYDVIWVNKTPTRLPEVSQRILHQVPRWRNGNTAHRIPQTWLDQAKTALAKRYPDNARSLQRW